MPNIKQWFFSFPIFAPNEQKGSENIEVSSVFFANPFVASNSHTVAPCAVVFGWVDWWWRRRSTSLPHTQQLHIREIKLFIVLNWYQTNTGNMRQFCRFFHSLWHKFSCYFLCVFVCWRIRCTVLRPFYNALFRSYCCVCHRLFYFILSHIVIRRIHKFICIIIMILWFRRMSGVLTASEWKSECTQSTFTK